MLTRRSSANGTRRGGDVPRQVMVVGLVCLVPALATLWVLARGNEAERAGAVTREVDEFGDVSRGFLTVVSGRLRSEEYDVNGGSRVGVDLQLETVRGSAVLRSDAGLEVRLDEGSVISLVEMNDYGQLTALGLLRGRTEFIVPRSMDGRRLSVMTADAKVGVEGMRVVAQRPPSVVSADAKGGVKETRFVVERPLPESGRPLRATCVQVSEGRVRVVRGPQVEVLGVDERSGCELPARSEPARSRDFRPERGIGPEMTLPEENALLTDALEAERRGNRQEAELGFRELLRRFPESDFSPDARAGLERLAERAP